MKPNTRPAHDKPPRTPKPAPQAAKPKAAAPKPELLAPAGKMETFVAALDAGADAVYVGAHQFNARMRAPNFSREELGRMAAFAHDRGRRLYLTVNTILKQAELPDLARMLDELRQVGPDALIVQDLGVCRLAQRVCPEIPIHASTQMSIHNLDGALQAQRLGVQRVILARELNIEEIHAIRSSCTVELEAFVHGAMCYSVAGQCFVSSLVHGKSANRGRCLQPCRRFFEQTGDESLPPVFPAYSMSDLGAAPILDRLIAAGIRCFKIEGRLKPAETIAQIVHAYRLLIDAWPRLTSEVMEESRTLLETAVGRRPCTGYFLSDKPAVLGAAETQSGRRLGRAEPAPAGYIGLTTNIQVKTGDRLRIQVNPKEPPRGFTVREMRAGGKVLKRPTPGKRIEIAVPFPVPEGVWVIKAADADAIPKGFEPRMEQLVAAVEAMDAPAFMEPDAAARQLQECLEQATRPAEGAAPEAATWVLVRSAEVAVALDEALEAHPTASMARRNMVLVVPCDAVETPAFRQLLRRTDHGKRTALSLPQFLFSPADRGPVEARVRRGLELGARGLVLSNLGHFNTLRALGKRRITTLALTGMHCMNAACHAQLRELGADVATASVECDAAALEALMTRVAPERLAVMLYGHPPMFQSRAPGPKPADGRLIMREPRLTLRVETRQGVTYTMDPRPMRLSYGRLAGVQALHWVYDFTWTEGDGARLAAIIADLETNDRPVAGDRWMPHPIERELE